MLTLIITLFSLFHQVDMVQLTLSNPSKEALQLRIENFNEVTIGAESESLIAMVVGERIYSKKLKDEQSDEWLELELLTVTEEHQGMEVNIYKLHKKAFKQ